MASEAALWWSLIVVGGTVAYSGATGQRPIAELRAALSGGPRPARRGSLTAGDAGSSSPDAAAAGAIDTAGAASQKAETVRGLGAPSDSAPTDLVPLHRYDGSPYGDKRLRAVAAEAFHSAQSHIGRDLPITTAYRDLTAEKARHAVDPVRFPVPNYHTAGQAIDVWQGKLPAGHGFAGWHAGEDPSTDPLVIAALTATGWQRFDPTGARGEAMHWSIGGRG